MWKLMEGLGHIYMCMHNSREASSVVNRVISEKVHVHVHVSGNKINIILPLLYMNMNMSY